MLTFTCVKVRPKDWKRERDWYTADYVNRLYRGIERNYSQPFEFICFTDDVEGIEYGTAVEVDDGWPGWWSKVQVYREMGIEGLIVYFDLDTVITGSLDFLDEYEGEFAILKNFYRDPTKPYAACMQVFRSRAVRGLWDEFVAQKFDQPEDGFRYNGIMREFRSDQEWLDARLEAPDIIQKMWPRRVLSFKADMGDGGTWGMTGDTSIVCYHGRPRPHECVDLDWMKRHWI